MAGATELLALTTNRSDSEALKAWLSRQRDDISVRLATGFYAAVAAVQAGAPVVVADVGVPEGRDDWRLAELATHARRATIVVVADSTLVRALAISVRADVAVTGVAALPPLRELLVTRADDAASATPVARRATPAPRAGAPAAADR